MRYRLIIFDFDGTLADSFGWFAAMLGVIGQKYGIPRLEAQQIEALRGYEPLQLLRQINIPLWKIPGLANEMRERMKADQGTIRLFPGVPEMLATLKERGHVLSIVSSNSEDNVRSILGPENARRIRFYRCGAGLFGKALKFRKVVQLSGVPNEQVLCVGDEIRDIHAARQLGLAAGAVAWGYATPEALRAHHPEAFFQTVDEIVAQLA